MPGPVLPYSCPGPAYLSRGWRALRAAAPHHTHLHSTSRSTSVLDQTKSFVNTTSSTAPHLRTVLQFNSRGSSFTATRHLHSSATMSAPQFEKILLAEGDGQTKPKNGDEVLMEYTGWLFDPSQPDNKGKQFDSSVGRGGFKTAIGVGRVIQGWDQGVTQMTLGEKSRLIIPGPMAYGSRGFPGIIPPNSTLVFDVELKKIN